MTEDETVKALVKRALADGCVVGSDRRRVLMDFAAQELIRRRRRNLFWWASLALLAASLALAICPVVFFSRGCAGDSDGVAGAIRLLCLVDGVETDCLRDTSAGELLLVWQDAPCADLL